jgi:NTP pyrophosphatase (non-canonical NTP hydrolase)
MLKLIKRHYQATSNRGLITDDTDICDFKNKIIEEFNELITELDFNYYKIPIFGDQSLSNSLRQESIDLVITVLNMLHHYGVDIEKELLKNIELQEKRAKTTNTNI